MISKEERKQMIANLPEDWKARAAGHFGKAESTVQKVAYGTSVNVEILSWLVDLAEQHSAEVIERVEELKSRINNLPTLA
jgi:hypothetical protein